MARKSDHSDAIESQPAWLQSYLDHPEKQRQLYQRTLIIVVISQIFGGAGLAAGITVGALLHRTCSVQILLQGFPQHCLLWALLEQHYWWGDYRNALAVASDSQQDFWWVALVQSDSHFSSNQQYIPSICRTPYLWCGHCYKSANTLCRYRFSPTYSESKSSQYRNGVHYIWSSSGSKPG